VAGPVRCDSALWDRDLRGPALRDPTLRDPTLRPAFAASGGGAAALDLRGCVLVALATAAVILGLVALAALA
jgi:hypothetical protein